MQGSQGGTQPPGPRLLWALVLFLAPSSPVSTAALAQDRPPPCPSTPELVPLVTPTTPSVYQLLTQTLPAFPRGWFGAKTLLNLQRFPPTPPQPL